MSILNFKLKWIKIDFNSSKSLLTNLSYINDSFIILGSNEGKHNKELEVVLVFVFDIVLNGENLSNEVFEKLKVLKYIV